MENTLFLNEAKCIEIINIVEYGMRRMMHLLIIMKHLPPSEN